MIPECKLTIIPEHVGDQNEVDHMQDKQPTSCIIALPNSLSFLIPLAIISSTVFPEVEHTKEISIQVC